MFTHWQKKKIWLVLVGCIVIFFFVIQLIFFLRHRDREQYFGDISLIENNSITVVNKEHQSNRIVIDPETVIVAGPSQIQASQLQLHVPVIVIGKRSPDGQTHAKLIRLFPPPNK